MNDLRSAAMGALAVALGYFIAGAMSGIVVFLALAAAWACIELGAWIVRGEQRARDERSERP